MTHDRLPKAPNGTGDALTAAFINHLLAGDDARTALEQSVASTVSLVMRAHEWSAPELPLVAAADVLTAPLIALEAEAV